MHKYIYIFGLILILDQIIVQGLPKLRCLLNFPKSNKSKIFYLQAFTFLVFFSPFLGSLFQKLLFDKDMISHSKKCVGKIWKVTKQQVNARG